MGLETAYLLYLNQSQKWGEVLMKIKTLLFLLSFFLLFTANIFCQGIEIYVSDAGNFSSPPWQILKFDENGENPSTFISDSLAWPQDILFLEDQNIVLISNLNSGIIAKHSSDDGAHIGNFASRIGGPTRMKIGADSLLYVLQWGGDGKVKRYQLDGTFVDDFTSIEVPQSIGLDWDSEGNLYVSSFTEDYVRKFDSNGNDLGIFVSTNLLGPTNIWFDAGGDLLVSDYNGTAVKRFDSEGNYLSNFLTGLSNSEGVAFLPNGNILIGNGATNSVKLFDSEGNYIRDFITTGAGNLMQPNAVVIRNIAPVSVSEGEENGFEPIEFSLNQNYPNPFNPSTKIKFTIPVFTHPSIPSREGKAHSERDVLVTLKIYDILGKEIATLVNEQKPAGNFEVEFNAANLPSGIYFYRLNAGSYIESKKMVLVK
jgi:hypothetical protein